MRYTSSVADTRELIGIRAGDRAVWCAPLWREDELVAHDGIYKVPGDRTMHDSYVSVSCAGIVGTA